MLDAVAIVALGLAATAGIITIMVLPARRRMEWLLAFYLVSLCFSGTRNAALGNAFEFIRLGCVAMMAVEGFRRPTRPGLAAGCIATGSIFLTIMLVRSDNPLFDVPFALGLLIISIPFPWAIRPILINDRRRAGILQMVCLTSVVYVGLAISGLGEWHRQGRFAGASGSPEAVTVFSMTGSFLALALLWGFLFGSQRLRLFCAVMFPPVAGFTVLAGQRAGTISALVGLIPFLVFAARRVPIRLMVAGISVLVLAFVLNRGAIFQFALDRLGSLSSTGRVERWRLGFDLVLAEPLLGHGPGTADSAGFGLHNAFLAAAYEGGILVGILWVIGALAGLRSAVRLVRARVVADGTDLLFLAWIAAAITTALVENKLYSPTNFAIFTFMFSATASRHLLRRTLRPPIAILKGARATERA